MPPARASAPTNFAVSDDEYADEDLDELTSDDEGDEKPPKGLLHGQLKAGRYGTFSLGQLYKLIQEGQVDMNPEYQRDVVWSKQKSLGLIQSLFLNFYVPPIIFAVSATDDDGHEHRVVIDGKQRCTSIMMFMNGEIPYVAPDKQRYYYTKASGARGTILPPALKTRWETTPIMVCQYDQISDQVQRDIFQRVQMGVALTKAETLQAIASPWTTWIGELLKKYVFQEGTLGDLFQWEQKRGKPFQTLTAIIIWCHDPENMGTPVTTEFSKFLGRSDPPDAGFKRKMEKALSLFVNLAATQHHVVFELGTIHGKPSAKIAPVEMWFMGYYIFAHMNVCSISGLAHVLRDMRIHAREREKDLFTNLKVMRTIKNFLTSAPVPRPGPNEQVAAVEWETQDPETAEAVARKRRREDKEAAADPDYRGAPVARGTKSDVVDHTRSKSAAKAKPTATNSRVAGTSTGTGANPPKEPSAYVRAQLPEVPTQRPPPSGMEAAYPTPALTATFGQPGSHAPQHQAPPAYHAGYHPGHQGGFAQPGYHQNQGSQSGQNNQYQGQGWGR